MSLNQMKRSISLWFWVTACIWTIVLAGSLTLNWRAYEKNIETFSLQEASTRFDDIVIARAWNARHGGLYGKIDQQTPPNPYLEGVVEERDITTPAGISLTLINPAYMTRQLNELLEKRLGLTAHITSLKPLRPANAADDWETNALKSFERGNKQVHQIVTFKGKQQMRLMRPLLTEKSCLQCHARQGYKEGDIRGGIAVAIPVEKYIAIAATQKNETSLLHGLIWLIGLAGLRFSKTKLNAINLKYKHANEKFKLLFDNSGDAIFIHDYEGNFVDANSKAMDIFKYSKNEFLNLNIFDLHETTSPFDIQLAIETVRKDGQNNFEVTFRKKDGSIFVAEVLASIFEYGDGGFVQASVRDITHRKQAEKRISLLSSALEQTNEAVMVTDAHGDIEYTNPAFTTITGYSSEEAFGNNPRILKSGKQDSEFYDQMWKKIGHGEPWQGKVIDKKKDGSFYPAMLSISPILNEAGVITNFVGIQQDMTDYDNLEAQFLQAQKMESIGTLVGGIAHDFNNMLASMTGNLYLAKQQTQNLPDVVQRLEKIEAVSFRAACMIKQLLAFARKDQVSIKPLPLNPFIKETIKFLETSIPENISVHRDICSDALHINGDSTQLHQVLMNLINNARDALEEESSPSITIKLETFHANKSFIHQHPDFKSGSYAHLSVKDNGSGIPQHQIEYLFEPFFTTKAEDKGTGLGLAMVFGAIKTHQGIIDVESIENKGSTFHIYLPLLHSKNIAQTSPHLNVANGQGETILLVDDQEQVISTCKEVLNALNYHVLTATNGQQALDIFKAHANKIDLILMDIVMPVMGGDKAAELIRQIKPDIRIIFSTGYDKGSQTNMANETILAKPFAINEMSQLIRQTLKS